MFEVNDEVRVLWPPFDEEEMEDMGITARTVGKVIKINSRHGNYQVMFPNGLSLPFDADELVQHRG